MRVTACATVRFPLTLFLGWRGAGEWGFRAERDDESTRGRSAADKPGDPVLSESSSREQELLGLAPQRAPQL